MDIDFIRNYCLTFPGVSEQVQWENCLLFKVGGKIFVLYNLNTASEYRLALKTTPEKFNELVETEGISQAPHFARNMWIAVSDDNGLRASDVKNLIKDSYKLVFEKLSKKNRLEIVKESK